MTELKITQADRDAAAAYWKVSRIGSGETVRRYKAGEADNAFIVQAFARHRIAAEEGKAELVEALDKMLRRRTMHPDREVLADEAAFLTAELAARGWKMNLERIEQ